MIVRSVASVVVAIAKRDIPESSVCARSESRWLAQCERLAIADNRAHIYCPTQRVVLVSSIAARSQVRSAQRFWMYVPGVSQI